MLAALRPAFRADGGDIVLLGVDEGHVRVRRIGACGHCPASVLTLRGALEPKLRDELPWFEGLSEG